MQSPAKSVVATFKSLQNGQPLPQGVTRFTVDGKPLFPGDLLFDLKATHGLPLEFALDKIIVQEGCAVDWVGFIEAARRNDWWDFRTYETVCHGMADAQLSEDMQQGIRHGFQRYVLSCPHPKMV